MAEPLIVEREPFLGALRSAMRVIRKAEQIPILGAALFEAKDNTLTISGTNLDQTIAVTIPAEVKEPSSLAVSADRLFRFASNLSVSDIELLLHPSRVAICKAGRAKAELGAYSAEDWPHLSDESKASTLTLDISRLRAFAAFCSDTMADDMAAPERSGLLIEMAAGQLSAAVAGFSGCACISGASEAAEPMRFTIPPAALRLLVAALPKSGTVSLVVSERLIVATAAGVRIVTKKLDREFIEWRRVVPTEADFRINVEPVDLRDAIARASAASGENAVRLEISGEQIALHAHGKDGIADDVVPIVDGDVGEQIDTGVIAAQACAAIEAILSLSPKAERLEISGVRKEKKALRFNLPGDADSFRLCMSVFVPPLISRARVS